MVSEDVYEDLRTIRIEKSLVEELNTNEEPEMVAIIIAKLELIRLDSKVFDKKAPRSFIRDERFLSKLKNLLESGKSADDILREISFLKFHETKEYFLSEDTEE